MSFLNLMVDQIDNLITDINNHYLYPPTTDLNEFTSLNEKGEDSYSSSQEKTSSWDQEYKRTDSPRELSNGVVGGDSLWTL